jgi:hypothetical protein
MAGDDVAASGGIVQDPDAHLVRKVEEAAAERSPLTNGERLDRTKAVSSSLTLTEAQAKLAAWGYTVSIETLAKWAKRAGVSLKPRPAEADLAGMRLKLAEDALLELRHIALDESPGMTETQALLLAGRMLQVVAVYARQRAALGE